MNYLLLVLAFLNICSLSLYGMDNQSMSSSGSSGSAGACSHVNDKNAHKTLIIKKTIESGAASTIHTTIAQKGSEHLLKFSTTYCTTMNAPQFSAVKFSYPKNMDLETTVVALANMLKIEKSCWFFLLKQHCPQIIPVFHRRTFEGSMNVPKKRPEAGDAGSAGACASAESFSPVEDKNAHEMLIVKKTIEGEQTSITHIATANINGSDQLVKFSTTYFAGLKEGDCCTLNAGEYADKFSVTANLTYPENMDLETLMASLGCMIEVENASLFSLLQQHCPQMISVFLGTSFEANADAFRKQPWPLAQIPLPCLKAYFKFNTLPCFGQIWNRLNTNINTTNADKIIVFEKTLEFIGKEQDAVLAKQQAAALKELLNKQKFLPYIQEDLSKRTNELLAKGLKK